MSDNPTPTPPPPDIAPTPRRRWIGYVSVALVSGVVGGFMFSGNGDATTTAAEPEPAPTVTVTAEPVEVEVATPACLVAVDAGDDVLAAFNFITDWAESVLIAASEFDAAEIDSLNQQLEDETPQYTGVIPTYETAAAECRAVGSGS